MPAMLLLRIEMPVSNQRMYSNLGYDGAGHDGILDLYNHAVRSHTHVNISYR